MQTNFLISPPNPNSARNVTTNYVGAHRVRPFQRQTNYDVANCLYQKTDDQWSPLPSLQMNCYEIVAVLIKILNVSML